MISGKESRDNADDADDTMECMLNVTMEVIDSDDVVNGSTTNGPCA